MKLLRIYIPILLLFFFVIGTGKVFSSVSDYDPWNREYFDSESVNIRNVNGKFYAYIVLLFNENPHFVNLIQRDSIPPRIMSNDGFHINAYKAYMRSLPGGSIKHLCASMLKIYLDPDHFTEAQLRYFEGILARYNIILKFSRDVNSGSKRIGLDYCIYGKKTEITIRHPLMENREKIYNILPYIYYDEFSTSNSTFYYDMIFINMDEVINDSLIASNVMSGKNVKSLFFVGSRVTENIRFCLKHAFGQKSNFREEIWKMFVIHELTHKMINNRYNYFDQVNGEELSLMSTIYASPYLGLAVMYSYLNYNSINPHRIAASNFVRFVSEKTGKKEIAASPGLIKNLPEKQIRQLARDYFFMILGRLN